MSDRVRGERMTEQELDGRLHKLLRERLHELHQEAYAEYNIDCDYLGFELAEALKGMGEVVRADAFGWIGIVAPMPSRGDFLVVPLGEDAE